MIEIKYPFLDLATVNAPYFEAMTKAASRVIESGRYIGGAEVEAFEREMGALCMMPYAVGVSNGLDALRLILEGYKALGRLKEGDGVIVPANTYVASVLAVTQAGLTPVLVDPDEVTMNLSAKGIEEGLGERTRAVMPVHLYGRVAWNEEMADAAKRHNLIVIEDAAQSIGARSAVKGLHGSYMAGGLGDAAAMSFYPTKNVGAIGDAGCVMTHDSELADTVKALANYGSDRRYHNIYCGFNCRLDPIQAAMTRVKLADVSRANARRFARAVAYDRHITHPLIRKPLIGPTVTDCVWHQYVIRVADGRRDDLQSYLASQGVGTDIHYAVPPHLQPCYKDLKHRPLPVTEQMAGEILSLPISDCTTEKEARQIANIINRF
jgi:degT/dnrJ/eryC1/strS aminotransferase